MMRMQAVTYRTSRHQLLAEVRKKARRSQTEERERYLRVADFIRTGVKNQNVVCCIYQRAGLMEKRYDRLSASTVFMAGASLPLSIGTSCGVVLIQAKRTGMVYNSNARLAADSLHVANGLAWATLAFLCAGASMYAVSRWAGWKANLAEDAQKVINGLGYKPGKERKPIMYRL